MHCHRGRFAVTATVFGMEGNERARLTHVMRRLETKRQRVTLDQFNLSDKAFDLLMIQAPHERFPERCPSRIPVCESAVFHLKALTSPDIAPGMIMRPRLPLRVTQVLAAGLPVALSGITGR